jgi:RNA polymerase sigma-70 factor (ECF subfamily)
MAETEDLKRSVEHLFRHESGRMLAALLRLFGLRQVEIAEDLVQETLLAAYEQWKIQGIPEQPRAWLYRTAKNKAVDFLRRERNFSTNIAPNYLLKTARDTAQRQNWLDTYFLDTEIEDAQLRMMFACCHPLLSAEQHLVLMLRTLCGLSTRETAQALLLPEDTIGKRLLRTKEKIKAADIALKVPAGQALQSRLDAVLQAVYLLFNESYKSSTDAALIRLDLCAEALRLCELLTRHAATALPQAHALMSLLCFQASRLDARMDAQGAIIVLEHQDRSRWSRPLIAAGYEHFDKSQRGDHISAYHIEAAIASYHASAPHFEQTNWKAIYHCYTLLLRTAPSPLVALNQAIALGYANGPEAGLAALLCIEGLAENHLWHAALGDFYHKKGQAKAAQAAYDAALRWATVPAERQLLASKRRRSGEGL